MCEKKQKDFLRKRGFSIIEVLLASFLLAVGLAGTVALVAGSMRHSNESRDVVIASQLAQEGVELVRNVRDNNFLQQLTSDLDYPFKYFPAANGQCRIDPSFIYGPGPTGSGDINCRTTPTPLSYFRLNLDSSTNFYVHGTGSGTKFYRQVFIETSGSRKIITSMVIWGGSAFPAVDNSINTTCTIASKCAFSQITLTDWRVPQAP